MEEEIEAFRSVEVVNGHHEAILILIVYFGAGYVLAEEAGVIRNNVSTGVRVEGL